MPVRGEPFDRLRTGSVEPRRPFDKLRANELFAFLLGIGLTLHHQRPVASHGLGLHRRWNRVRSCHRCGHRMSRLFRSESRPRRGTLLRVLLRSCRRRDALHYHSVVTWIDRDGRNRLCRRIDASRCDYGLAACERRRATGNGYRGWAVVTRGGTDGRALGGLGGGQYLS